MSHLSLTEVRAGNPLHLALLALALGFVVWNVKGDLGMKPLWFCVGLVLSFLLFCTAIRWSAWSGRLHLPVFVLGSAVTGLVIEIYFSRRTAVGIAIVLLASGFVFASLNKTRSLVRWTHVEDVYQPRAVLYFSDQHENSAFSFLAAAEA